MKTGSRLAALCLIVGLLAGLCATSAAASILSPTPYMGWTTYYGVGGNINEQTILSAANKLISTGLAKAGYRIVWLDWGWAWNQRDSKGHIYVWPAQWPHGLPWLTAYLHQRGLLAGIYTDAGASGCSNFGQGSLGHYQTDVDDFAAWGFDAVKVDFCGALQAGLHPQTLYTQFAQAIANNASHRPMIFNVANLWMPRQWHGQPDWADSAFANYLWAPKIATSWRTDTDISFPHVMYWSNVLRNLDADAAHPSVARPGHWNDPDALGPGLRGLTFNQAQAQVSMWAMLAAPLILGSDPRALSTQYLAMLENRQVLAIDQDPLGRQGTLLRSQGSGQVWVRQLAGGVRAVALLNRGATPLKMGVSATQMGLRYRRWYSWHNVWAGNSWTDRGTWTVTVPGTSVRVYRISGP
jgi:alpha-galactosidase